jgi:hypothetical protein
MNVVELDIRPGGRIGAGRNDVTRCLSVCIFPPRPQHAVDHIRCCVRYCFFYPNRSYCSRDFMFTLDPDFHGPRPAQVNAKRQGADLILAGQPEGIQRSRLLVNAETVLL